MPQTPVFDKVTQGRQDRLAGATRPYVQLFDRVIVDCQDRLAGTTRPYVSHELQTMFRDIQ